MLNGFYIFFEKFDSKCPCLKVNVSVEFPQGSVLTACLPGIHKKWSTALLYVHAYNLYVENFRACNIEHLIMSGSNNSLVSEKSSLLLFILL